MEAQILASHVAFLQFLHDTLEKLDEEQMKHEEGRYRPGGKVDLYTLGDDQWLEQFWCAIWHTDWSCESAILIYPSERFTQEEAHQLVDALDLPIIIKCSHTGIEEDRLTALCMLLWHLSYPTCLVDVEMQLGWERSQFSRIT